MLLKALVWDWSDGAVAAAELAAKMGWLARTRRAVYRVGGH